MDNLRRIGRWLDAIALKTIKTMAQTAVGIIAAAALFEEIEWKMVLSACIVAGLVCMLTNLDTLPDIDASNIFIHETEEGTEDEED